MKVGEQLQKQMELRGMNMLQFANHLGVSPSSLCSYLANTREPSSKVLNQIATRLHVKAEDLAETKSTLITNYDGKKSYIIRFTDLGLEHRMYAIRADVINAVDFMFKLKPSYVEVLELDSSAMSYVKIYTKGLKKYNG